MATLAEQLTLSNYVVSPLNHNCFSKWAGTAEENELEEVMQVIYTVEHRMGEDLGMFPTEPIVVTRPDLGRSWPMRMKLCQEENCLRCETGRGGWGFRWVGPWTRETIVGDEHTAAQTVMQRAFRCQCGRH